MEKYLLNKVDRFNPEDWLETAKDSQGLNILSEDGTPLRYLSTDAKVLWFRMVHPEGALYAKQIASPSPSIIRFRADVFTEKGDEKPISSFEYQKSWRQDCGDYDAFVSKVQTVALGKALSRAGFGCEIEARCNRGGVSADVLFDAEDAEPDSSAPESAPASEKANAPAAAISGADTSVQQKKPEEVQSSSKPAASVEPVQKEQEEEASANEEISADEIFRSMEAPSPEEPVADLNFPPAIDVPDEEEDAFPVSVETTPKEDGVLKNQVRWAVSADEAAESDPSEKKAEKKSRKSKKAKTETESASAKTDSDEEDQEEDPGSEEPDGTDLDDALNTVFRLKDNAEELGISQGLVTLSWQNVTLSEILKDHKDFLKVILDHKKVRDGVAPEVVAAAEVIRKTQN